MPASKKRKKTPAYYPAFIDLSGRKALVVGGGRVAARKVVDLLESNASVSVVAPDASPRIESLALKGRIRLIRRPYRKSDLKAAFIVIAASDSEEINSRVSRDAKGLLVNVVDAPALCSFIVPSKVRRGPLVIAVSTSGASPAMARAVREELERLYPPKLGRYIESLASERTRAIAKMTDAKKRRRYLKSLASEKILAGMRKK